MMKSIAIIFAVFIAVGTALPPQIDDNEYAAEETRQGRLVTDQVSSAIEDLSETIRQRGMDPFYLENVNMTYSPLSVKNLLELAAGIQDVLVTNLSNLVINKLTFSLLTRNMNIDVSIPEINLSCGNAKAEAVLFNEKLSVDGAGKVVMKNLGIKATVKINLIGAITGSPISSLDINFYLDSIDSQIERLNMFGSDVAAEMNDFLSKRVHKAIDNSKDDISELIESIAWKLIEK